MKPEARAGRLLVLGFEGSEPPQWLISFARRFGLGGVILFARNCPSADAVRALTARVRETLRDPANGRAPLVFLDQEGGRVERIREGVPHLPPAREMAALGGAETRRLAEAQARALSALGVDVNLAPVCDVVRPGESGVIGDRAFGDEPHAAAAGALAFYEGLRAGGFLGCAKHFPGHGASPVDTHLGAGRLGLTRAALDGVDLVPFRALAAAGVDLVMANHLVYPAVDESPAVLSPRWLGGVLRGEMGFTGAVISDDMEMAAMAAEGDAGATARRAVEAGCDLLIYGRMLPSKADPEGVAAHLAETLAPARMAECAARLARLDALRAGRGGVR